MPHDLPHIPGHARSLYRTSRKQFHLIPRRRRPSLGEPAIPRRDGPLPRNVHRSSHVGRRWPRRVLVALAVLVVLVPLLGIAGYFYVDSELGGIQRTTVASLTPLQAGQPMDVLIVGSDSRSFITTPGQARSFGSRSTGQRSDVIVIARFSPNGDVEMLSIPRDTWVPIAGTGGSNKINAAFNNGPNQLVQTIQDDFGIPINHVMMANFAGFEGMVNALGGIYLDFKYPVRDRYSGLHVHQTGCQLVTGAQSLSVVRSRHLYYFEKGSWHYDGMSDWSRIRRQQAFFHALLNRIHSVIPNVFRLNSFLKATVVNLQSDSSFASSEMISLGLKYHSLSTSKLRSAVLPTSAQVIGGQDALVPAKPYSTRTIARFLAFGKTPASTAGSGTAAHEPQTAHRSSTTSLPPGVVNDSPQSLPEPWNPTPC